MSATTTPLTPAFSAMEDDASPLRRVTHGDHATQEGDVVMPFYLIVDTSGSMAQLMASVNQGLRQLQQLIRDNPAIADIVQVCVIAFDSTARVAVPMGPLEEAVVPELTAQGGTNYSGAFRTLRQVIDADVERLLAGGFRTYRSCAFFLTDGVPTDTTWQAEFAAQFGYDDETKSGNHRYPRFIPFGFGGASMDVLTKLAYPAKGGRAFVQSNGAQIGDAFEHILGFVGRTIVASGLTGATNAANTQHVIPETLPGFEVADSEYAGGGWMS